MIRHGMSAAYLLRDGFSGAVLTDGSATRCLLDGRPLRRPLWKREGYLVLTDLEEGEHLLQISRRGYRDEFVTIPVGEARPVEDTITLKPGAGYRFPRETVRVSLTLKKGGMGLPSTRSNISPEKCLRKSANAESALTKVTESTCLVCSRRSWITRIESASNDSGRKASTA